MNIAEPLSSFDITASPNSVKKFMEDKDYDVIGIRENGFISGYVKKVELSDGIISDYLIHFNKNKNEIFSETTSLIDVFKSFKNLERIFVLTLGEIGGIVTRGDLQKITIRMWLFSLISLIEMQLLRIIREYYPGECWKRNISDKRLKEANKLFLQRQASDVAIDLLDCVQFCDKRDIILKNKQIIERLGFNDKLIYRFLKDLEILRNSLAHAQNIIAGELPDFIILVEGAEDFLYKCEGI